MEVRERMPNTHLIRGLKDLERIGKEAIHEYIMIKFISIEDMNPHSGLKQDK